jgi:hypothetical protein
MAFTGNYFIPPYIYTQINPSSINGTTPPCVSYIKKFFFFILMVIRRKGQVRSFLVMAGTI